MTPNNHDDLKEALQLLGITFVKLGETLENPVGKKGISHTAIIRVSKGIDSTEWIQQEIEKVIQKAHAEFPGYYRDKQKNRVA